MLARIAVSMMMESPSRIGVGVVTFVVSFILYLLVNSQSEAEGAVAEAGLIAQNLPWSLVVAYQPQEAPGGV